MIKKINISDERSVEVNSSAGWLLIYRETFGNDVLPELMPVIEAAIAGMVKILEEAGEEVTVQSLARALEEDEMTDVLAKLSMLEFVTILKIFWALAKNADKSIPSLDEWANEFEILPMDIIVPELFGVIASSMVSRKNLERLRGLAQTASQKMDISLSTASSSEQSQEDSTSRP